MSAASAIRRYCVECIGSGYEVPLCIGLDCPLWPHRLGCRTTSKVYRQRVEGAWARGGDTVREVQEVGMTLADFLGPSSKRRISSSKQARTGGGQG